MISLKYVFIFRILTYNSVNEKNQNLFYIKELVLPMLFVKTKFSDLKIFKIKNVFYVYDKSKSLNYIYGIDPAF